LYPLLFDTFPTNFPTKTIPPYVKTTRMVENFCAKPIPRALQNHPVFTMMESQTAPSRLRKQKARAGVRQPARATPKQAIS
jgi:hypothetical protein